MHTACWSLASLYLICLFQSCCTKMVAIFVCSHKMLVLLATPCCYAPRWHTSMLELITIHFQISRQQGAVRGQATGQRSCLLDLCMSRLCRICSCSFYLFRQAPTSTVTQTCSCAVYFLADCTDQTCFNTCCTPVPLNEYLVAG